MTVALNFFRSLILNTDLSHFLSKVLILLLRCLLPILPLMAWIVFCKKKYLTEYRSVLSKMRVHVEAISRGPIQHYFETLFQQDKTLYESIDGHCSKCGNCCLNRSCVFLESIGDDQFSCGIYHSRFRRFSNCGSFPINGHDIVRYQCPTYKVIRLESIPKFAVESSSSS